MAESAPGPQGSGANYRPSRRDFLGSLVPAAAAMTSCARSRPGGRLDRPNVIVVLTDDQRADAMSCTSGDGPLRFMHTPAMDRLAREGIRFRNTFVTTSLCSPSRASILTGKNLDRHGVVTNVVDLNPAETTFPGLLRQSGYDTCFVGKWHLGRESDRRRPEFRHWVAFRGQGTYFDPTLNINGSDQAETGYVTDLLTDHAIEFIRQSRSSPFFLFLSHKAPHGPCTPPKHLETLFSDIDFPLPRTYFEDHSDKPDWFVKTHNHDAFHTLLHPKENYDKYAKDYCRSLVSVDENLGRLVSALDEQGLAEDTAIFFLGDNGHFLGEHQLFSKMFMYEESIRIPLIVRYPRFGQTAVVRDEMVLNIDLAPTILALAGVEPEPVDGTSFLELLAGEEAVGWRQSFRYQYLASKWGMPSLEGVRTDDNWKYVRFRDWEQLYNVHEDPDEIVNLALLPEHQDKKRVLATELERLGGGGELGGPNPYELRHAPMHRDHRDHR